MSTKKIELDKYPYRMRVKKGKKIIEMRDKIDDVPGSADFLRTKRTKSKRAEQNFIDIDIVEKEDKRRERLSKTQYNEITITVE